MPCRRLVDTCKTYRTNLKGGTHLVTTLIPEVPKSSLSATSKSTLATPYSLPDGRFAELIEAVSRNVMLFPLVDRQHVFILYSSVKDQLSAALARKGLPPATIARAVNYVLVSEQPSYGKLFQYANQHLPGHVVVIHRQSRYSLRQTARLHVRCWTVEPFTGGSRCHATEGHLANWQQ
jgi:hypothetical protein